MSDRDDVQLAIGYGLGVGMVLASLVLVGGRFGLSFLDVQVSVPVLAAVVAVAGVAIAAINALKLNDDVVADLEDTSE